MSKQGVLLGITVVTLILGMVLGQAGLLSSPVQAQAPEPIKSGGNGPEKAIVSTAEFMKLLVDPTYEKLKDAVAAPPAKRAEWRALYVAAFSLAEINNLYFSRGDEEFMSKPEWKTECDKTQALTVTLAESIRAQADYAVVKENFIAVMKNCNDCHRQFEPGEIDEILPPAAWGAAAPAADGNQAVQ